eukprot:11318255-Alexandrium_andersonii.AAC.1
MSASLVGSEMCIRDRPLELAVPGPGPLPTSEHLHPCPQFLRALGRLNAVSYTHLTLPTICSV